MWFKIDELYADTDVHFIQCNKAFVSSVSCKNKCMCIVMTDWLISWLIDAVSLGEIECTQCRCDSTNSCTHPPQYVNIWDLLNEFPQRCAFLFRHSFSYSFIHSYRRACCQINFQCDCFTVALLDIPSDTCWLVLHCQKVPKVQKRSRRKQDRTNCGAHRHPCLGLWLVSRKNLPLWSSPSMAFKMVLAPCCLWENPANVLIGRAAVLFFSFKGKSTLCPRRVCWN